MNLQPIAKKHACLETSAEKQSLQYSSLNLSKTVELGSQGETVMARTPLPERTHEVDAGLIWHECEYKEKVFYPNEEVPEMGAVNAIVREQIGGIKLALGADIRERYFKASSKFFAEMAEGNCELLTTSREEEERVFPFCAEFFSEIDFAKLGNLETLFCRINKGFDSLDADQDIRPETKKIVKFAVDNLIQVLSVLSERIDELQMLEKQVKQAFVENDPGALATVLRRSIGELVARKREQEAVVRYDESCISELEGKLFFRKEILNGHRIDLENSRARLERFEKKLNLLETELREAESKLE